ncbi:ABC transporter permease (plasmid) [Deinococcus psychrotolerans]|uniref:ABC transporter permease n=1 Tax=Deinococcus psychrotolerans TaxID=2489213 RepID=A0A3G8YKE8_9DEIO|nr:ABC transporter permease [Deinococcus psychrotolerans]AZI44757.1 ABC transporter permease [Deinococcus psychrotolerans]
MAATSVSLRAPASRSVSGWPLLLLSALGLLALSFVLAGRAAPPDSALVWLLGVLALLLVGVFGIRQSAQGETLAARIVPAAATLILLVLAAEALLRAYGVPTGLIPTPSKVMQALWAARVVLLQDAYYTFVLEALLGFIIGTLAGLALALAAVRFRFLERGVLPYAALLSSVPIVALAPVVIKAVGLGWSSKTIIVAVTVLFPVVINAVRGLQSAQPMHLDLMHSYAASPTQVFHEVRWPSALPFVFTALRVSSTLALINAIVAEFFGTEGHGLGFRIQIEVGRFGLDIVWAAIVVASVIGVSFYLLISAAERLMLPGRT